MIKTVFFSHRGNQRQFNEDALLANGCVVSGASMENPSSILHDGENGLFAVFDGMGGYTGGALAARIAVTAFLEELPFTLPLSEERLKNILTKISRSMKNEAEKEPSLAKMGATLAGLALSEVGVTLFNCGDCRVYRFRSGYLDRLSRDHSLVQELVDRGEIAEEEMRTHPQKNIVTATVQAGSGEDISFFFRELPRVEGDEFFICSDGVWEALVIDELEECLRMEDMTEGCKKLSQRLLETECKDNISFVFLRL